jgi:ferredoxin--NADP+ reductase
MDGETAVAETAFPIPANVFAETVVEVKHYTDRLFSFRITRPRSFRFRSGEFVMIGLPNAERPVYRAYSIASPAWDESLEFFSIKVADGPLTEPLSKIVPGDVVLMKKKSTGTLVNDALLPGERLWMFSTGTGVAPFASLIRDPETYDKFGQVILTHTCRLNAELAYGAEVVAAMREDPLVGEFGDRLTRFATVTREPHAHTRRITDMLRDGALFETLGVPPIDPETDRAMICGGMEMLRETKALMEGFGLDEGSNSQPGRFVVERAFVG